MKVKLTATRGIFRGLSRQNMLFHQCLGELIDNAIAAMKAGSKFKIEVILNPIAGNDQRFDLYIADSGRGMDVPTLAKAIQLGESATTDSRLNEHGFGLKNSLATLSGDNAGWELWTRESGGATHHLVKGPFQAEMEIEESSPLPSVEVLPDDIATLIHVQPKYSLLQTVQGRGAPAKDLSSLRTWLIEHLGVMYRGFLEQDSETVENDGVIGVAIANDRVAVAPISVPLGRSENSYIEVTLGGHVRKLEYRWGTLDETKRDSLVRGKPAKFYYQQNQPTQGIDIRLGKRVIATRLFETIWKTEDGNSPLSRHNNFNDFAGELLIPELPRGVLTTTNNKTDFNLDDPDWACIFSRLNSERRPPKTPRERGEADVKKKWMAMLNATNPSETVSDEVAVWPPGACIDVYRKTASDDIIIYELKVTTGTPIHLYQLKMYWDGLVDKKEYPKEALLLCDEFNTNLEDMANKMNKLSPPKGSKPYNFKIERLKDKGI